MQRLMSKTTKTLLPVAQHLLEPELQSDVERKLTKKRRKALTEGPKNFLNWKLASPSGLCLLLWTRVGNGEEGSALRRWPHAPI